jgi:hypothetical protein
MESFKEFYSIDALSGQKVESDSDGAFFPIFAA